MTNFFLKGYNCTIFAYGMTSVWNINLKAGKSYTMLNEN